MFLDARPVLLTMPALRSLGEGGSGLSADLCHEALCEGVSLGEGGSEESKRYTLYAIRDYIAIPPSTQRTWPVI